MTKVAVVAHARKTFGGGLGELREVWAPWWPDCARWRRRKRLEAIIAVSLSEKKADMANRTTSVSKSADKGMSSTAQTRPRMTSATKRLPT